MCNAQTLLFASARRTLETLVVLPWQGTADGIHNGQPSLPSATNQLLYTNVNCFLVSGNNTEMHHRLRDHLNP